MTVRRRIALVGFGKVARTQHLPAIDASERFQLVAVVDPAAVQAPVPVYPHLETLLDSGPRVEAVALCQPPQARYPAARTALRAGLAVLLEKPPGVTVAEVEALADIAAAAHRTLFTAWHSRFAAAVPVALEWLSRRQIRSVSVHWKEDVRQWHPGQQWIWEPGGMGVFDAGINALSIVTRMTSSLLRVCDGTLWLPSNRSTPIAATLRLETTDRVPVHVELDWRTPGEPQWDIDVETDRGSLRLAQGGARLWLDGVERTPTSADEYGGVYARFAALLDAGASEVDIAPMRLVVDALARCDARRVDVFEEAV